MHKCVLFAAVSTLFAGAAVAQSSVTLFGIVDATLRDVKNGSAGSMKSLTTSGYNSSRLGFRGMEDLGDGLQASFWLELGFGPDSGATTDPTRFFNRRATVSLSSSTLGEVKLGRDITPSYIAFASVDPFGDNGIGGISVLLSGLGSGVLTQTRADNQVSYILPSNLGGVIGQVAVAAGENVPGAKYTGGMVGWSGSTLLVQAAYAETTITTDKYKQTIVSGSYDFGPAKLFAGWTQGKYRVSEQQHYLLGVTVPVGLGLFRASYVASNLKDPAVAGQALSSATTPTASHSGTSTTFRSGRPSTPRWLASTTRALPGWSSTAARAASRPAKPPRPSTSDFDTRSERAAVHDVPSRSERTPGCSAGPNRGRDAAPGKSARRRVSPFG